MEKQIETVYVGTMEDTTLHLAKRKGEWNALNSSMNLCHSLKEVRAYLYTQEEHAAVQRYREALAGIVCKIVQDFYRPIINAYYDDKGERKVEQLNADVLKELDNALSKAEYKGEGVVHQKRCFTPCAVWAIEAGHCSCYNERPFEQFTLHPESSNPIATDRTTITQQPTNSLDEFSAKPKND